MRELEILKAKHTVLSSVSWIKKLQALAEKRATNKEFVNECKDKVDILMETFTLIDAIHKENDFLKSKNTHIENEINRLNELIDTKDRYIKSINNEI